MLMRLRLVLPTFSLQWSSLQLPVCLGTQVDTRDQDQEDVEFNFCLTFLWQNASKSEPMSESKSESLFE